jgi:hypothetical protein
MAALVLNQETPMYSFDQDIEQIYFRNDTISIYQVVLIPDALTLEDFPPRSIVINGCAGIEKITCICKIVPGQCVKINKVSHLVLK